MSLGQSPTHEDLYRSSSEFCEERLSESSIYRVLHQEGHRLFPDEAFADLFSDVGRRSVPPRIVAVVMVLQRIEGLSDREAVERFAFDLRWKYAAGGLDFTHAGFVHTVLVDMRARLRASERPDRIFEAVLDVARSAGLVGRKRVLDSTALYDAVATQDTVTLIRSAIRGLLRVADDELQAEFRSALKRDDEYKTPGKPACDWDDADARELLVDALARDGFALLTILDDRGLSPAVASAGRLLATVLGQDLEQRDDGVFRIARRVAPDRVISTVDPESRHGHKTAARGFDGFKGHIALDPDSEIITATEVTAGNAGDATVVEALLSDVLPRAEAASAEAPDEEQVAAEASLEPGDETASAASTAAVYGDASYGTADIVERLEGASIEVYTKVQSTPARTGMFSQDDFEIDTAGGTIRCPNGEQVQLRQRTDGSAHASFGSHCSGCPLRGQCTASKSGRAINVHPKRDTLQRARDKQRSESWKREYRATRPKVERKFGHMMRRKHGGRRARVRGRDRIRQDFSLLAAGTNLLRLVALGVRWENDKWVCGQN